LNRRKGGRWKSYGRKSEEMGKVIDFDAPLKWSAQASRRYGDVRNVLERRRQIPEVSMKFLREVPGNHQSVLREPGPRCKPPPVTATNWSTQESCLSGAFGLGFMWLVLPVAWLIGGLDPVIWERIYRISVGRRTLAGRALPLCLGVGSCLATLVRAFQKIWDNMMRSKPILIGVMFAVMFLVAVWAIGSKGDRSVRQRCRPRD
jgi:hypothetical protein